MAIGNYCVLEARGVIAVSGRDTRRFLQALISQDLKYVTDITTAYGALLTPQGKYLHDFIIAELGDAVVLDCEADRADDLAARLSRYRLRSEVIIATRSEELAVAAIWGDGVAAALDLPETAGACAPFADGCVFIDPRNMALGARSILARARLDSTLADGPFAAAPFDAYDAHRMALGVPDGSRDMDVEKSTLLEAGIDALNGVAWDKGCFIGQELTARMHYRGLVKKRLMPVTIQGPAPAPGTPITADGRDVGVMHSSANGHGLALLRLDAVEAGTPMTACEAAILPS